jgi:hypothetical protein
MNTIPLSTLIENPDNPSAATDEEFARLVEKIRRNPDGLKANRIAYVSDDPRFPGRRVVLSGNKRLRALKAIYGDEASIPGDYTQDITPMTSEQRRIYLVAANVVEGEWDSELMRELYTPEELGSLLGEDALDKLAAEVESAAAAPADSSHDDEMVELSITLPSEDYRKAYLALVSRNDNISTALMEAVDERA